MLTRIDKAHVKASYFRLMIKLVKLSHFVCLDKLEIAKRNTEIVFQLAFRAQIDRLVGCYFIDSHEERDKRSTSVKSRWRINQCSSVLF